MRSILPTPFLLLAACANPTAQDVESGVPSPGAREELPPGAAPGTPVRLRGRIETGSRWRLEESQRFPASGEARETVFLARWDAVDEEGRATQGQVDLERIRQRMEHGAPFQGSQFEGLTVDVTFEGSTPRVTLDDEGRGRDLSAQLLAERSRLRVLSGRSVLVPEGEVSVGEEWEVPIYEFVTASGLADTLLEPRGTVRARLVHHDPESALATLTFVVDLQSDPSALAFHLEGEQTLDTEVGIPRKESSRGWIRLGGGEPRRFERSLTVNAVEGP